MPSLSEQLREARSQAEVCLYSGSRVLEVRAGVMALALLPLPPCSKYLHIAAENMVVHNSFGSNRKETLASLQRLSTALNILEKYGCNLTNPNRPKYWRTVKHNNPVFRATVDAVQGGRAVLALYGYSNQQPDGLSFPDDISDPDVGRVAAVAVEVMSLRMELEMLIKETHQHPEFYERVIPTLRHKEVGLNTDAVVATSSLRPQSKSLVFPLQRVSSFSHHHSLTPVSPSHTHPENCTTLTTSSSWQPPAGPPTQSPPTWHCPEWSQDVQCEAPTPQHHPPATLPVSEWVCRSCTVVNAGVSVLCEVCDRPRLATRPPVAASHPPATPPRPPAPVLGMPGDPDSQWVCQFCTYLNYSPATACEMCDLARPEPAPLPAKLRPPSPVRRVPALPVKRKVSAQEDLDSCRQRRLKEEGLKLVQLIREGEKVGMSPEEVYTWTRVAGDSPLGACRWMKSQLPLQLDKIITLAATLSSKLQPDQEGEGPSPGVLHLSRAEAKQGWLSAGGATERAARQALRDRLAKVQVLVSLGFREESRCHEVLRQGGGQLRAALTLLQRPLMDAFHQRIWSQQPEPPLDIHHPDKQMQSLTSCQCSVCCGCFQQHFTIAVRDKHIRDMVCPVCWEPDINDPEHLNSYFSTLDIQLRECLEPEVYELFHKKLTEQALIKDPKFLWCCHCSYGFIYDGDQLKVTCFQCRNTFCAHCKKPWESQHAGLSCEQYQWWKRENDPEYQRQGLAGYLRDNGITCPNCRFQYALSKGGCMHFCCSQCRYQFCSGCNNPFHTTCAVEECTVSGLHAHHPRDCLFYLRDWEPSRLQALLQKNGVTFNTDPPPGTQTGLCGVIEQKDDGGQQADSACGAHTQPGHAGLCEKHYREYLVSLINSNSLDPAHLYTSNELLLACRRYKVEDSRAQAEDGVLYYSRLMEKLMAEVPLGDKVPRKK
ncbi:E3 ubiquitin-protein ligase RNF31 isoform X2 [Nerophis ophidion]|uniref:E3 ubiquitin-protein ligase RNF31 isoform X2 n=1 Tax=Nerophis ophidion TaxID=159077 RepID=UPI002ADF4126|nr:E3 ubiquitin-protein ligase RNF31 isoform X2 [Nerophis ophidion]